MDRDGAPANGVRSPAIAAEAKRAELTLARFDRLQRLAARPGLPREVRAELEVEAKRVLDEAAPVRVSFTRHVLGLSKPTIYKWIAEGQLEQVAEGPDRVSLRSVALARGAADDLRARTVPPMTTAVKAVAARIGFTQRTLWELARLGAVRARTTAKGLDISPRERAYVVDHGQLLRLLADEVAAEPGIETAVLFGSLARGDENTESDVDLLVEGDALIAASLADRLEAKVGRPVDTVTLASAERQPSLLEPILDEGRPLLMRSDSWQRILARRDEITRLAAEEDARIVAEGRAAIASMKARAR